MPPDGGSANLLMSMGLDLSPVKAAADTIKSTLNSLNELSNQVASAAVGAAAAQSAEMKELKSQAQAAVLAAKEAIATENAKAAAIKTQTAELQRQKTEQQGVTAAAQAGIAAAKEKQASTQAETAELKRQTAELQRQSALLRQQAIAQRVAATESREGGGGGAGGLAQKVVSGFLGRGLAGSVAGGVLAGEGLVAVIEGAGEAIEHFIDKLKEVSIESGNLVALQHVFDGLAKGAGVDATEMMNRLAEASEGLVSKMSLLKEANMALRSPFKFTTDDVVQLTHDVTLLAESSGHTAQQGIDVLTNSFARGRPMALGAITGVAGLRDVMRDIPPAAGPAERSTIQWQRAMKMLHDQALALGDLPDTFEKMSTRMKVASENMLLAFGQNFNQSFASGDSMTAGVDKTTKLFKDMENAAGHAGDAVGNAFRTIGQALEYVDSKASQLKEVFGVLFGTGIAYVIEQGAVALLSWGAAAVQAATATNTLATAVKALEASIGGVVTILAALLGYFSFRFLSDWKNDLSVASGAVVTWGDIIHGTMDKIKTDLASSLGLWHDVLTGNIPAAIEDVREHLDTATSSLDAFVAKAQRARLAADRQSSVLAPFQPGKLYGSEAEAAEAQAGQGGIRIPSDLPDTSLAEQNKQASKKMQLQMEAAKLLLAQKKEAIQEEQSVDAEAYEYENESLEQHYAALKDIAAKNRDAAVDEARLTYAARTEDLKTQLKIGELSQVDYNESVLLAQKQFQQQFTTAESTFNLAIRKIDDEGLKDQQEARQRAIQGQLKSVQDSIAEQQRALQSSLQQGETSPDTYFQKQIQLTQQLTDAKIEAANREYANSAQNTAALQTRANAINSAVDSAQDKMEQLISSEAQVRLQYVERQFQPQQQAIESQIAGLQPGQNPAQLQSEMAALLERQRESLEQQISQLPAYSDGWNQIFSKIEQVYQMQQKYNDELRKSQDLLQPISDALSSITHLVGTVWTSHFVRGLTAGMQGGIEALKGSTQAGVAIRGAITGNAVQVPKDPQMQALEVAASSAANTFGGVKTSASGLGDAFTKLQTAVNGAIDAIQKLSAQPVPTDMNQVGAQIQPTQNLGNLPTQNTGSSNASSSDSDTDSASAMQRWTTGLVAVTGELSNFADALTKSTSVVGGMASGATGGAGIGNTISSALGVAGPWGQIAGAAAGAILGGITGAKNAEMSSELSALNTQYTSIMDAFHSNTDNLQEAIQQMQELISEASVDEANSKKGGSQFASLISQYSEQLVQLQDQQSSIISDMETQLAVFSTPTGMQQFLTNLNQIIEQYDKFAGAAENAMQLAQANSWLTDSLSSYTTQMENTFVQDEEGGINDALQLNSLLSERSTLISNLNDSIMNVLEQGVLTRQQTTAQTKGQQIELLESQSSSQLDSINQEISLEQYKVAIETSLYNLAMTSMGLEAQLLALQEGQASQSLAAIQALQQLISALQGGSYNFGSISAILASLGFSSNIPGSGLDTVETASGNGQGVLDALASAAYQSRATLGYAAFRGATL